jgi:hypothetical protein
MAEAQVTTGMWVLDRIKMPNFLYLNFEFLET